MSFACSVKATSLVATVAVMTICVASCNRGPSAVKPPSISASGAGSKAMELYDKDDDGKVAGPELDGAPALKAAMATLDTDGDQAVDADEVAARVKSWQATPVALTGVKVKVTMDGQPLPGAEVVFEPDPCLGDDIKLAKAITGAYGDVAPVIPPELRGSADHPGGIQLGLYLVRITKNVSGKETVPARYNTNTTLGQEIAYDDPAFQNRRVGFALKSAR
jgi:hypothetical protein